MKTTQNQTTRFTRFGQVLVLLAAILVGGVVVPPAAQAATLTSTDPSSGTQKGGTVVTLTGTGFLGATMVAIGGFAASYTVNSDTQITFTTPVYPRSGLENVQVRDVLGNWAQSALFTYTPPPSQVITFANPGPQAFGTSPTLSATGGGSGLPVTFTSSTAGVCTVTSGGVLTFVMAGTCEITANQAEDSVYAAASPVTQSFSVIAVAPGAPTAVSAVAGNGSATVSFTAPVFIGGETVSSYTVTSSGGQIQSGSSSPISVTGLTNGTAYTFTVTATNTGGTGPASGASTAITPKAPQVIIFANPGTQAFSSSLTLSATGGGSGLPVTFTSSTEDVCRFLGENLVFDMDGTCTINADQAGNSAYLAAATVPQSFTVVSAPGAPMDVSAVAGNGSATVSFTAPESLGGETVSSYKVTSEPGGIIATGPTSPISVTGLTNGIEYTFTVTATNDGGTGPASDPSTAIIPQAPQVIIFANPGPQAFSSSPTLSATGGGSGLPVTFTSSTTGVCTVTSGGVLTFLILGTCTINVNQTGNSAYLAAMTVPQSFSVTAVAPGAPTAVSAVAGNGSATVSFTAPVFIGGETVSSYTVTSSGGQIQSGSSSPISVTGLTNGTAYTFTVTATNASGTGPASDPSTAITPQAPQVITFANPGSKSFGTSPALVASSDSSLPVTFTSSTTGVCTVTSGGVLTFLILGTCTINVNQTGNSAYLAAMTVPQSFSVTAVAPGAPTAVSAVAGNGSATVSFTAPVFIGGETVSSYTVTSSGGQIQSGSSSPISVTGLTNGTAYTFTVTATNASGTGPASDPSGSVTASAPRVDGGGSSTVPVVTPVVSAPAPVLMAGPAQPTPTELKPGVGSLMIDGVATPVTVSPSPDGKELVVSGGGVRLVLNAVGPDGKALPLARDGSLVLSQSGGLPMAGSGFAAGSTVTLFMFSTPVTLGTATANATGGYSTDVVIPAATATGSHTIQVIGTTASGQPIALSVGVTVKTAVAARGSNPTLILTPTHSAGSKFVVEARGVQARCNVKFWVKGSTINTQSGAAGKARAVLTAPGTKGSWVVTATTRGTGCDRVTTSTRVTTK